MAKSNYNITLLIELLNNNKNIKYLNLSNNLINNYSSLFNALMNYQIETLKLECLYKINIIDIKKLLQTNKYIKRLNISNMGCQFNMIGSNMSLSEIFKDLQTNNPLLKLNISYTQLDTQLNNTDDLITLQKMIENNKTLINLNINNCLDEYKIIQVIQSLQRNNILKYIRINNFLYPDYKKRIYNNNYINELCKLIKYNKSLQIIYLNINLIFNSN